ncbi:39S ribosomal protein L54, mitochondrial [Gryllus bimaculatus]|nr:39S ribosomal protein L54, mitochondrial [Gryllus bimaculatus]
MKTYAKLSLIYGLALVSKPPGLRQAAKVQGQARNKPRRSEELVKGHAKMLCINSTRICTSVKNAFIYTMQHCAFAKKADTGLLALGKKKKGKLGPIMEKKVLPVVEDANKLVNYVCGSNILKEGEDIKIKPDNEYPEWLWSIRTG